MDILDKIKLINKNKKKEIKKFLKINKYYNLEFIKRGGEKQLSIKDGLKKILVGDYNFYGIYQPYTKLWIWATSIPGIAINKNINYFKSFSHLFESSNDNKSNFYYQLLTQDILLVPDQKMIFWINELILYLSDDLFIFNPTNTESNIQFITLTNIKEKYI